MDKVQQPELSRSDSQNEQSSELLHMTPTGINDITPKTDCAEAYPEPRQEKSFFTTNKICNKAERRIPDRTLIKAKSTKRKKAVSHKRRVSIGINLTRKNKFVKRGDGKNASRPDVILKHILRSLKRFVVDQMKSGDIEAFDCNVLSR